MMFQKIYAMTTDVGFHKFPGRITQKRFLNYNYYTFSVKLNDFQIIYILQIFTVKVFLWQIFLILNL